MRHGGYGAVIRMSPNRPVPVAALGLPSSFHQICSLEGGLVVVAGPRSSGRSTTIAALVHELGEVQGRRVATIEHPVETLHEENGRVSQRGLEGSNAPVETVVRAALREDPDVLVIDAPGNPGSIPAAMRARGPLVLLVLDASDGRDVLSRLLEACTDDLQAEGRHQLSVLLRAVLVQRLVPSSSGGRVAAVGFLLSTAKTAELLREGDAAAVAASMSDDEKAGRRRLDDALYSLASAGEISVEDAAAAASIPPALRERLQSIAS
jgi:twitching motility protein PilT